MNGAFPFLAPVIVIAVLEPGRLAFWHFIPSLPGSLLKVF